MALSEDAVGKAAESLGADICKSVGSLVEAIAGVGAIAPSKDAAGGSVGCLTESVMGVTAGLMAVADAIRDLADAVRERRDS